MIPPRKEHKEDGTDAWLMSYADMITLLLCFFVIFVSVSEPKKDKFSLVTEGLANKFGSVDMSTPLQGVLSSLQATVEDHQIFRDAAIVKNEKSIEMELASGSFFDPASAAFRKDKEEVLAQMAAAYKSADHLEYHIIIESYTSDVPVSTPLFPSNWELSAMRATHLVRYFISQGIKAERLSVVAYGETQPKLPNRDASDKPILENQLQNDRVVIKFERVM